MFSSIFLEGMREKCVLINVNSPPILGDLKGREDVLINYIADYSALFIVSEFIVHLLDKTIARYCLILLLL